MDDADLDAKSPERLVPVIPRAIDVMLAESPVSPPTTTEIITAEHPLDVPLDEAPSLLNT